jgi:hypothetical protein
MWGLATGARPQLSNYYPFLGGVNVFIDAFPANPTTWYVGTYLHLILLWTVVLRRVRVTAPILALSLAGEIAARAALMPGAGSYVAYMILPNWATVFLLGVWYGQRQRTTTALNGPLALAIIVGFLVVWVSVAWRLPLDNYGFPFMGPQAGSPIGFIAMSAAVSMLYIGSAWLTFAATSRYGAPAAVRFIARNTLIVFLAHMPIYYALVPWLSTRVPDRSTRAAIFLIICLPVLAWVSEGVRWLVRPRELRRAVEARWWRPPSASRETPDRAPSSTAPGLCE